MQTETPIPLAEIVLHFQRRNPPVDPGVVHRVARKCTHHHYDGPVRKGHYSDKSYFLSEVTDALQKREDDLIEPDCYVYTEGDVTYVARDRKTLKEECGLSLGTVDGWEHAQLIAGIMKRVRPGEQPATRFGKHGRRRAPRRRKFFEKAKLMGLKGKRLDPSEPIVRERIALDALPARTAISFEEADAAYGVKSNYIYRHWDRPDTGRRDRRRNAAVPPQPLGHLIRYIALDSAKRPKPGVDVGDIRTIAHKRDNPPPLPDGAKLLSDALPLLTSMNANISKTALINLIESRHVEGGRMKNGFFNSRLDECQPYWVKWNEANIEKIKPHSWESRGDRLCWIGGDDYHPIFEAAQLVGLPDFYIYRHVPVSFGGFGEKHAALRGATGLITCARHNFRTRTGKKQILVLCGEDLRDIAEHRTGKRPSAPKKPAAAPPPANPPEQTAKPAEHTNVATDNMIRISDAARRLDVNPGQITRAVDAGFIDCNGRTGVGRRVLWQSCQTWNASREAKSEVKTLRSAP